jgi:hypothetical protein
MRASTQRLGVLVLPDARETSARMYGGGFLFLGVSRLTFTRRNGKGRSLSAARRLVAHGAVVRGWSFMDVLAASGKPIQWVVKPRGG